MKIKIINITPEKFVSRMFYLLWRACGGPMGMGVFQDRPGATEEQVFQNAKSAGDYPGGSRSHSSKYYGDYVFGRMMKFGCEVDGDCVILDNSNYTPDYQAWCRKYPDNLSIVTAVSKSLSEAGSECAVEVVEQ